MGSANKTPFVTVTNYSHHKLTYNLNGGAIVKDDGVRGKSDVPGGDRYDAGTVVTLDESIQPTRDHAIFMGWKLNARPDPAVSVTEGQVTGALIPKDPKQKVTFADNDITVYAVWKLTPSSPGGSSSDDGPSTYPPSVPKAAHGSVSVSPRSPQRCCCQRHHRRQQHHREHLRPDGRLQPRNDDHFPVQVVHDRGQISKTSVQ